MRHAARRHSNLYLHYQRIFPVYFQLFIYDSMYIRMISRPMLNCLLSGKCDKRQASNKVEKTQNYD